MTSARQRASNRINARRSTGPRTPAGKMRASRNAVRHGFTLPVSHDAAAAPQVATLARAIVALACASAWPAGVGAAPACAGAGLDSAGAVTAAALAEPACRIAEAQVDLVRIRRARHELLVEALAGPARATPRLDLPTVRSLLTAMVGPQWAPLAPYIPHEPEHPGDLCSLFTRHKRRLRALDRYERRARARRRSAVHDLDRARLAARRAEAGP